MITIEFTDDELLALYELAQRFWSVSLAEQIRVKLKVPNRGVAVVKKAPISRPAESELVEASDYVPPSPIELIDGSVTGIDSIRNPHD